MTFTKLVALKRCTRCGVEQPVGDFFYQRRQHRNICKGCQEKENLSTETFKCTRCELSKLAREFYVSSGKRHSQCKSCAKTYRKRYNRRTPKTSPEKKCSRCLQVLDSSAFYSKRDASDGLQTQCKECMLNAMKRSRERPAIKTAWGSVSVARAQKLMITHHLSFPEVVDLLSGTHCPICTRPFGEGFGGQVDHNHITGELRGLLCLQCNLLLGNARDQPDILLAALNYLGHTSESPQVPETVIPATPLKRVSSRQEPSRRKVWEEV